MKTITVTYTIEVSSEMPDDEIEDNIYQAIELGIGISENMELLIEGDD
tara:strand:+ start:304 stop:447 length:144 start_codon:yes stop_codon:yes gene_type:complete